MKRYSEAILSVICALFLSVTCSASEGGALCRAECKEKKIALTFDDGPHPVYTPEILEILSEYRVRATFFVVGENAEKYPDIIIDEIAGGHEIGNHTYSHAFINKLSVDETAAELEKNESVINAICERKIRYVRPPGGIYGDPFLRICEDFGYTVVLWSVDTRDWKRPGAAYIEDTVNSEVGPGDIILMHDYVAGGPSSTPEALRSLIPSLLGQGYEFVTLDELTSR